MNDLVIVFEPEGDGAACVFAADLVFAAAVFAATLAGGVGCALTCAKLVGGLTLLRRTAADRNPNVRTTTSFARFFIGAGLLKRRCVGKVNACSECSIHRVLNHCARIRQYERDAINRAL